METEENVLVQLRTAFEKIRDSDCDIVTDEDKNSIDEITENINRVINK